jgi:hypothetical protein
MSATISNSTITSAKSFTLKSIPKSSLLPPLVNAVALLADKQLGKPTEIVIGLIHQLTKVVLGGSSKAGKTWLLLLLALCVATGKKFLRWNTTPGKVLYINLEIHPVFFRERLDTLMKHLGMTDCSNPSTRNKKRLGTSLKCQILPTLSISSIHDQIIAQTDLKSFPDQRLHHLLKCAPLHRLQIAFLYQSRVFFISQPN